MNMQLRDIPHNIDTYSEALAVYEKIQPWRGETDYGDERPLQDSRKRICRIRIDGQQNIRLRYHNTDVVTYHPDGSITIEGYSSRSTQTFVYRCSPFQLMFNICGMFWCGSGIWSRDGLMYPFQHQITLRHDGTEWMPVAPETVTIYAVDRKETMRLQREYPQIKAFRQWAAAALALGASGSRGARYARMTPSELLAGVLDKSQWPKLLGESSPTTVVADVLDHLRHIHNVKPITTEVTSSTYDGLRSMQRRYRKFGGY